MSCYGVMSREAEADNRGVAEGEDGYSGGTTGLPVGLHLGGSNFTHLLVRPWGQAMVKDVIDGIKETEVRAAAIVEEARRRRAQLVGKAREEGRSLMATAHEQGKQLVKQALETGQKDAERKVEEIAAEEKATREKVRQASSRNISRAVETVIERMLK